MADLEELFDVVDENNAIIGQEKRSVCHKLGIMHRAVYVFLFDQRGRLLIQKRAAEKKIGPNQWDLSIAEHLQPGESYVAGARRGLHEELGLDLPLDRLPAPLNPPHKRELIIPDRVIDREFVQSFRVDGLDPAAAERISFDPAEVQDVRWATLEEIIGLMQREPDSFTLWFRQELAGLDYFGAATATARVDAEAVQAVA